MKSFNSLLAMFLLGTTSVASAQVVIHEVNFDASPTQWIEIRNVGKTALDISNWSLYQATKTSAKAQNYWFGFPSQTVLGPDAIIQIHWGAKIPASPKPWEIYTGDDVRNFLFGYGFEALDKSGGALALLNTKLNNKMNDLGIVEDWVSWGSSGFKREDLAVQQKLWNKNTFVKAPDQKQSIALAKYLQEEPTPVSAFFLDHTPTPALDNHGNAHWEQYGTTCSFGTVKPGVLTFDGVPAGGNDDFAFVVNNTRGPVFQEKVFLLINQDRGHVPFGPCALYLKNFASTFILGPFPAGFNSTRIPLSLNFPSAAGAWLDYQAFVGIPGKFDYSLTNGLDLFIGN